MRNVTELSSSASLASSCISNGSSPYRAHGATTVPHTPLTASEGGTNIEVLSLTKLSSNLERLLLGSEFDCTDAEIMVEGAPVGIHRCILAARSNFFCALFSQEAKARPDGKPRYDMDKLVPGGQVGREAFMVFLSYLYTGKLKPAPPDVSICVEPLCPHDACRPAIAFAVELMYACSVFQIQELVSLLQRRLLNFVEKATVEDVIPILQVASHSKLSNLLNNCVQRVARSNLDDIAIEKALPQEVADEIRALRHKTQFKESNVAADLVHEKIIKRIHRALDCDDVELVKLFLSESGVTLDDAYALHYAAAYSDPKIVAELLDLSSANVNLNNDRGYTPLHVAAMRREPAVIVSLLNKGASAVETTSDGQNAVTICRKLTRARDYSTRTERGQMSNKNKICIDILERELRTPMTGEDSVTSPLLADDPHMKLLYLENRVEFARLLFPAEARLAMEIAHADTIPESTGLPLSSDVRNTSDAHQNEKPSLQNKRLGSRVDALMKTVDLGRRYFPHCSLVLDKLLGDDLPDLFYLETGTDDEQKLKRLRFCELKEDVKQAFNKDKARGLALSLSSSFSSSSLKVESKHHKHVRNRSGLEINM